MTNSIGFCETCIRGKHHRSPFEPSKKQVNEPLELVHTDVCGKMSEKSIGSAEYFMTFIIHNIHYYYTYNTLHYYYIIIHYYYDYYYIYLLFIFLLLFYLLFIFLTLFMGLFLEDKGSIV